MRTNAHQPMKHAAIAIVLTCAVTMSALCNAQQLTEKSKSFRVIYRDGTRETILVKYQGFLDTEVHQSGSSSKPFEGHPIDDRRCDWSIKTYVLRQAYFVSKSGNQAPIGALSHTFDKEDNTGRGPSNMIEALGGYNRPCSDEQGNINSQVAAAKSSLEQSFAGIVDNDARQLEKDLADLLHPVKVVGVTAQAQR